MIPKALANAIVILVSLVWAGNFAASVLVPEYQTDSAINFVFMTIVGGALALRRGPSDRDSPGAIERMASQLIRPPAPPSPPPPPPSPDQSGADT